MNQIFANLARRLMFLSKTQGDYQYECGTLMSIERTARDGCEFCALLEQMLKDEHWSECIKDTPVKLQVTRRKPLESRMFPIHVKFKLHSNLPEYLKVEVELFPDPGAL